MFQLVPELLPCPFCGVSPRQTAVMHRDAIWSAVECCSEHCRDNHIDVIVRGETEAIAIANWNGRMYLSAETITAHLGMIA